LALGSVLPAGETLFLKYTSNISAGGTSTDVTESVHPENKFIAERIARLFNLDICGIDVMTTAIDLPLSRERGAVIEVNAGPGLRMHSNPQKGIPRNVAAPIADMLFPKGKRAKVPIVAVADSKGANVITRLTAYFTRLDKYKTGYKNGL
jgi:cyanophycin synthetase